jgi:phosphoglycerate dehydrogenase-like enzyme
VNVWLIEALSLNQPWSNLSALLPRLQVLRSARQLKLIIQFGVGVEAIDIPTVSCELEATDRVVQAPCTMGHTVLVRAEALHHIPC